MAGHGGDHIKATPQWCRWLHRLARQSERIAPQLVGPRSADPLSFRS
jgi:hypothetical protein